MASLSTLQTINVDLLDVVMETLYANQDESGTRTAQCCVRLQGVDWNVPSDVSVFLKMHKPNHINIYKQIGVDGFGLINGNVISFPITQSMTTVPGRVEISLEFIKGSNVLYSTMSYLRVLPIAFDHQAIEDTNEYLVLKEYVKDAKKYKDLSQSYAIGTGNTIRENDETDNSKYYHELAKQSETNAKASEIASKKSETNAKQSETNALNSEKAAKSSETNAKQSENNAETFKNESEKIYEAMKKLEHKIVVNKNEPSDLNINDEWLYFYE